MDTSDHAVSIGRRRRRRHSAAFRAEAVAACQHPGVSIAAVALARGLNANLLRRWVLQAERGTLLVPTRSTAPSAAAENPGGFAGCCSEFADSGPEYSGGSAGCCFWFAGPDSENPDGSAAGCPCFAGYRRPQTENFCFSDRDRYHTVRERAKARTSSHA